jgi:hypothetical protein
LQYQSFEIIDIGMRLLSHSNKTFSKSYSSNNHSCYYSCCCCYYYYYCYYSCSSSSYYYCEHHHYYRCHYHFPDFGRQSNPSIGHSNQRLIE